MFVRLSFALVFMMVLTSALLRVAKPAPPAGGLLVVANQKEHTVLVVDPDNRRELAKISVGVNGHEVIVSKDGRFAYVPIYGNSGVGRPGTDGSTIDVIDLLERKLVATIDLGKPLRPHRAEIGPDGLLYVTAELANAVDVIDPGTRKVLAEIPIASDGGTVEFGAGALRGGIRGPRSPWYQLVLPSDTPIGRLAFPLVSLSDVRQG